MSQKSSRPQPANSVSQVLMPDIFAFLGVPGDVRIELLQLPK
jgi:hypothetical protein